MRQSCLFTILLCLLSGSLLAADIKVSADVSCRTEISSPTTNRHDSSKLSVRSDASSAKSWIKFDQLGSTDPGTIRGAKLRIALHDAESGSQTVDVSAVNDGYTTNIGWLEREITWSNAPANDTTSYTGLLPEASTFVGTISYNGGAVGQQFEIDVLQILQADTDGIVQFVLHNSNSLHNYATHDHGATTTPPVAAEEYWPTLILTLPPAGADWPNPENGDDRVPTSLAALEWVNPEPNSPGNLITCDVFFGTEPNRPSMTKVTLPAGASSAGLATYFPSFLPLQNNEDYYWLVDSHDPEKGVIEGEMWHFYTNDNQPPVVDAGAEQVTWLDAVSGLVTVTLAGTVTDDGLPAGGQLTSTWTRVANGAPDTPVINSPDATSTTVTFTENGDYLFQLTANDGGILDPVSDTVRVVIGDDACDASHIQTGDVYNPADQNQDCLVDLTDLVNLIVSDWLECTDVLTNCAS